MTLALIAGQGGLPPHLVQVMRTRGEVPVICEIEQFPSQVEGVVPRITFRLEQFGTFLAVLTGLGVNRLCMAGAMRRPPIDPAMIDAATMPLVPRIQSGLAKGDDGTLRTFIELFEEQGIEVIGAAGIDPALLPGQGVVTGDLPETIDDDVAAARAALAQMAQVDLGQAVVVRDGKVIVREDDAGTDAMLAGLVPGGTGDGWSGDPFEAVGQALDSVADWLSGPGAPGAASERPAAGALLYKAPKPGQELRVDMPVIGPQTARRAAEAGLSGIVIEAGGVMLLEPETVRQVLEARGLFLWVRPPGGPA